MTGVIKRIFVWEIAKPDLKKEEISKSAKCRKTMEKLRKGQLSMNGIIFDESSCLSQQRNSAGPGSDSSSNRLIL